MQRTNTVHKYSVKWKT